jgi:hypothetical protein
MSASARGPPPPPPPGAGGRNEINLLSSNEKENRNTSAADDDESSDNAVSYRWLDEGVTQSDGLVSHDAVQLTSQGRTFSVRTGDAVLLFSDESDWGAQWPCRVERMWEPAHHLNNPDPPPVFFTARWFWHKGDLEQLPYQWEGSLTREELVSRMEVDEVVLSNHLDENEIATIEGPCYMTYKVTSESHGRTTGSAATGARVHLPKSFQCQYKVDIRPDSSAVTLLPMTSEDKRYFTRNLTEDQRQAIQDQRRALREHSANLQSYVTPHAQDQDQDVVEQMDEDNVQAQDEAAGAEEEEEGDTTAAGEETEEKEGNGEESGDGDVEENEDMDVEQEQDGSTEIAGAEPNDTMGTSSSDGSDDDDSASSDSRQEKMQIIEGEGSNLRSDILVGGKHQAVVGPFVPGHVVRSRKPKLVWKANQLSETALHDFLNRLADIHTPYLSRHGLTTQEPYYPLPVERTEELMRQMPAGKSLTGSSVSTASSVCIQRNALLKECNIDAALEILHDNQYNVDAALEAAKSKLESLSGGWTRAEKEIFDQGFRHYDGSLRMIGKKIGPTKTFRDVVDYHYRFKIPDQFRLYQTKRREQAVRMMDCIEKRRYHDHTLYPSGENNTAGNDVDLGAKRRKHWSETSATESTGAVEERRQSAKDLLLEVQNVKGKETMAEVAAIIRQLHTAYDAETKDALLSLLRGHPELQKRFLDFLPKRF